MKLFTDKCEINVSPLFCILIGSDRWQHIDRARHKTHYSRNDIKIKKSKAGKVLSWVKCRAEMLQKTRAGSSSIWSEVKMLAQPRAKFVGQISNKHVWKRSFYKMQYSSWIQDNLHLSRMKSLLTRLVLLCLIDLNNVTQLNVPVAKWLCKSSGNNSCILVFWILLLVQVSDYQYKYVWAEPGFTFMLLFLLQFNNKKY